MLIETSTLQSKTQTQFVALIALEGIGCDVVLARGFVHLDTDKPIDWKIFRALRLIRVKLLLYTGKRIRDGACDVPVVLYSKVFPPCQIGRAACRERVCQYV